MEDDGDGNGGNGDSHVLVCCLHGLGGVAHVLQHLRVGVGVLQRLPLELDGGQRPVDLGQLLLVALLPLQGLERRCVQLEHQRIIIISLEFIFVKPALITIVCGIIYKD